MLVAVLALLLGAVVAVAQTGGDGGSNGAANAAAGGFRDYDRADADQYGVTSTVTTPVSTTTVTVGGEVAPPTPPPPPTGNAPVGGSDQGGAQGEAGTQGDGGTKPTADDDGGTAPANAEGGGKNGGGAAGAAAGGAGTRAMRTSSSDPDCPTGNPRQFGNGGSVAYIALTPARYPTLTEVRKVTGPPAYLAELYDPLNTAAVAQLTAGTKWAGAATDLKKLAAFAAALGRSVVDGGALAKRVLPALSRGVLPTDVKPLSGVVLTHCVWPLPDLPDEVLKTFFEAFVGALRDAEVPSVVKGEEVPLPVVGAERTDIDDNTAAFFKPFDIATVDHVDTADGKLALARLLAGADKGDYGVKKTATDGVMPEKPERADQPLQYRPSAAYAPADASGGGTLPGGAATVAILLLLVAFAGQAIVLTARRERRRLRARR